MSCQCLQPVLVLVHGEWKLFSCRRCTNCIKGRKSDYVGRALLEAQQADATFFTTLTFAPGEAGANEFVLGDIQRFFKRLRQQYKRQAARAGYLGEKIQTPPRRSPRRRRNVSHRTLLDRARKDRFIGPPKPRFRGARLRYLRAGERGTRGTKRCHQHMLLFCEGPVPNWERSAKTHAKELWDMWPHGWADVQLLPPGQFVRKANYVCKYVLKSAFDERPAVGFSSRPALGTAGLVEIAKDAAAAGVAMREIYRIHNVVMTRGKHKGEHRQFRMSGRARDSAFKAYRDAWIAKYGSDENIPPTDWMLRYDPDAVFVTPPTTPRMRWHKRPKNAPRIGRGLKAGTLMVINCDGRVVGALMINKRGVARFSYSERPEYYGNELVKRDLRGLVDLPEAEHERVSAWLADHRGPDWIDYDEYIERRRAERARLDGLLRDAAEIQGKAALHDPAYFKGRDALKTMDAAIAATEYVRRQRPRDLAVSPAEYSRKRNLRPFAVLPDPKAGAP